MTNILDTLFASLIFPGGAFPVVLGLGLSFVLIALGFGVCDMAYRFLVGREGRSSIRVCDQTLGGQHD